MIWYQVLNNTKYMILFSNGVKLYFNLFQLYIFVFYQYFNIFDILCFINFQELINILQYVIIYFNYSIVFLNLNIICSSFHLISGNDFNIFLKYIYSGIGSNQLPSWENWMFFFLFPGNGRPGWIIYKEILYIYKSDIPK